MDMKEFWKSQEEIEKELEEQEKLEQLPTDEERIELLEQTIMMLMMEGME